jgi:hypothetical protein
MIHYQLRCAREHAFDGWFPDSAAFDRQAEAGLVECPVCGDVSVTRGLMAPAVARAPAAPQPSAPPTPAQVKTMLRRLRAEIERNCDYVGPDFADEARKIHTGEAPARRIYGESTPEQAEALADEGIEIASIPWIPITDA